MTSYIQGTIITKARNLLSALLIAGLVLPLGACNESSDDSIAALTNALVQMGGSIQGEPIVSGAAVTTLAGDYDNYADGIGTAAHFYNPTGLTSDGTNLYLADQGNNRIRQIEISTGVVTTLAGSGSIGSADGTGIAAQFFQPSGITTDGINLYVADTGNNRIRKIVISTGEVSTLAGDYDNYADGIGTSAHFYQPTGITTDGTNLYVSDMGNYRIRKIVISSAVVTTLAGNSTPGNTDGTGAAAQFNQPYGITTDGTNLYIADRGNNRIRQIVIDTGEVSTLAGDYDNYADGIGTSAHFYQPTGITTDGVNLFLTDTGNARIRQIVISTAEVTTIAGDGTPGSTDGTGAAAQFSQPYGITTDGDSLFVTGSDHRIRYIQ